jgi:hypothetical protein
MKKSLSAEELVAYLDKKSSQLEGDVILQQVNPVEGLTELSQADALNRMYEIGFHRGTIMGQKEILLDIALLLKFE